MTRQKSLKEGPPKPKDPLDELTEMILKEKGGLKEASKELGTTIDGFERLRKAIKRTVKTHDPSNLPPGEQKVDPKVIDDMLKRLKDEVAEEKGHADAKKKWQRLRKGMRGE